MDANVKTHQLPELRVGEAELISIVSSVVKRTVTVRHCSIVAVLIGEDDGADAGHLSAEINGIFECGLPQLGLVNTIRVSLQEVTPGLAGENTH